VRGRGQHGDPIVLRPEPHASLFRSILPPPTISLRGSGGMRNSSAALAMAPRSSSASTSSVRTLAYVASASVGRE
jgi:hypothetical protein